MDLLFLRHFNKKKKCVKEGGGQKKIASDLKKKLVSLKKKF